jgi:hypothetical protein
MRKTFLILPVLVMLSCFSFSQSVGIGTSTPNTSAQLDITSTSKGLLIPRMNTATINSISNPAKGLLVYDSLANQVMVNTGTPASPNWQTISSQTGWSLMGNSGINQATQFIGTADNKPVRFRINSIQAGELHPVTGNIFWGIGAGQSNTSGFSNVAMGPGALKLNTNRSNIVAIGDSALFNNGTGSTGFMDGTLNTAIGSKSLFANTTGNSNTAIGYLSLFSNTTGNANTAIGYFALNQNSAAGNNTSIGALTLFSNGTGDFNVAVGNSALFLNTTAHFNTAVGTHALFLNSIGESNVAVGSDALLSNTGGLGQFNTAIGRAALSSTTGSEFNTAVGYHAASLFNMGFNNTILGANCDVNNTGLFNCIAIGQAVTCTANSQARVGNSATNSIGGFVNWTNISDGRYKKDVTESVIGLDFIMKLRPVTYHLDVSGISKKLDEGRGKDLDASTKKSISEKEQTLFSGFVAQEVEQAAKEAGYDFSGVDKPKNPNDFYGLRYAEFVVPLVKAVQELSAQNTELKNQNTELKKQIGNLQERMERLEAKKE